MPACERGGPTCPATFGMPSRASSARPVVAAVSQPGGFSPGSADRVRTAAGRRAFVKALRGHARPAAGAGIARHYDDGEWIALVFADVGGRHPALPWRRPPHVQCQGYSPWPPRSPACSPAGTVLIVDWPWACTGPAWLDTLLLRVNVRLYGGHDTVALPDVQFVALAGVGGFFADAARQPAPPGLPTLRAFQQAQADAVLAWLREVSPAG